MLLISVKDAIFLSNGSILNVRRLKDLKPKAAVFVSE